VVLHPLTTPSEQPGRKGIVVSGEWLIWSLGALWVPGLGLLAVAMSKEEEPHLTTDFTLWEDEFDDVTVVPFRDG
jgi:hypothetical protein